MSNTENTKAASGPGTSATISSQPAKPLSPEAVRALKEAEERRNAAMATPQQKEVGGRSGPDPTRYGDWEKGGIASDF